MLKPFLFLCCTFSICASAQADDFQERITIVGTAPTYLTEQQSVISLVNLDLFGVSQVGSVADALSMSPQINLNGQGGLFQTISIRGFSRWRIQTLIEGVPIHSERRAGNAAEFLPPDFLGGVYLMSGAASTQLGSGAMGGGIDLQLAATETPLLKVSSNTQQAYRNLSLMGATNTQNSTVYWAGNVRRAKQGSDAAGEALFNQFESTSGLLRWSPRQNLIKDALLMTSLSRDIGKASSDPIDQRFTLYPKNNHWLAKIDFDWQNARLYAHQADFDTRIVRTGERTNLLSNHALNWGAEVSRQMAVQDWLLHWRFAMDARTGVKVAERELSAVDNLVFERTNLSGRQFAYSFAANATQSVDNTEWAAGFRTEYMKQESDIRDTQPQDDINISGFVGATVQWDSHWRSGVYVSSGYRVPTLTERYFSGSTPRGMTIGDPLLKTEQATNVQAELDYQADDFSVSLSVFSQSIDHYIERVSLSPVLRQYVNIGNAEISGASYQFYRRLPHGYYVRVAGQLLSGEGDDGEPINDVSPDHHSAIFGWRRNGHEIWLSANYRADHQRPGDSEIYTDSTRFFRAGYKVDLTEKFGLEVQINNATDELYRVSTDEKAPNALGRDVEVNLTYFF